MRILVVLGVVFSVWAYSLGDMELGEFVRGHGFTMNIDLLSQKITLHKNNTLIEILPDSNLLILNKNQVFFLKDPIRLEGERVILPGHLIQKLLKVKPSKELSQKAPTQPVIHSVLIDAGHGGKDPGNIHHSVQEKDITLTISKHIKHFLSTLHPHLNIILIREQDEFISLEHRSQKALQLASHAQGIFVSIHANASLNPATKGIETYFYSSTPNKDHHARLRCFHEQVHTLTKNPQAHTIISQLYNLRVSQESFALAHSVHSALYASLQQHTLDRGVKSHQPYFVITKNLLPSILVEIGFLSNEEESLFLREQDSQTRIAKAIAYGISQFIGGFNVHRSVFEYQVQGRKS